MVTQWTGPAANDDRLTTDDLFFLLGNQPRRLLLFHLRQNGVAPVDELVDVVADLGDVNREVGRDDRARLEKVICFHHLPLLERHGLVVIRLPSRVELPPVSEELGEWLDLAIRRELQASNADEEPSDTGMGDTITILLVDDEPNLADVVGGLLMAHNEDFRVVTAENAPDAYATLREEEIDCIVSDYLMPAIDGLDFLQAVREEFPTLPFILFTNKGSEEIASKAIEREVTGYVRKSEDTKRYDRLAVQIRTAVEDRSFRT